VPDTGFIGGYETADVLGSGLGRDTLGTAKGYDPDTIKDGPPETFGLASRSPGLFSGPNPAPAAAPARSAPARSAPTPAISPSVPAAAPTPSAQAASLEETLAAAIESVPQVGTVVGDFGIDNQNVDEPFGPPAPAAQEAPKAALAPAPARAAPQQPAARQAAPRAQARGLPQAPVEYEVAPVEETAPARGRGGLPGALDFAGMPLSDYFDAVNQGKALGLQSIPGFEGRDFGYGPYATVNTQDAITALTGYNWGGFDQPGFGHLAGARALGDAFEGMMISGNLGRGVLGASPGAGLGLSAGVDTSVGGGFDSFSGPSLGGVAGLGDPTFSDPSLGHAPAQTDASFVSPGTSFGELGGVTTGGGSAGGGWGGGFGGFGGGFGDGGHAPSQSDNSMSDTHGGQNAGASDDSDDGNDGSDW
jgi:hypothetical protein